MKLLFCVFYSLALDGAQYIQIEFSENVSDERIVWVKMSL